MKFITKFKLVEVLLTSYVYNQFKKFLAIHTLFLFKLFFIDLMFKMSN